MKVSVVIPNYNGQKLLQANLPSVIAACRHWSRYPKNWQIIVVDDASTDASVPWLKQNYPQIKVIRNQTNLRFARSVNRGVNLATGDIIVLLNNDVKPAKDFLSPLLSHFKDPQVFAVGCLEENLKNQKKILGGRGVARFSRGFLMHQRAKDQTKTTTLWVAAGSGAFRKTIWRQLGGLDSLYRPAYEEDRDLSYTALKAGFKLVFEPKSKVIHHHETTNLSIFGASKIQLMSFKNQLLFVWKNISSPRLIFNHLLWLPYHLTITSLKTKGLFWLSFIWALSQLIEAMQSRSKVSQFWQLSDEQVVSS